MKKITWFFKAQINAGTRFQVFLQLSFEAFTPFKVLPAEFP